jgi:asparagine synthase (glutamine-hydrolysing)
MCGLVGIWGVQSGSVKHDELGDALRSIAHRGPDKSGTWVDERNSIVLGHRRLSILDLSPAGDQPMMSHDGRWVIIFNGEIYNWQELHTRLRRDHLVLMRGHSDTEILVNAIATWGINETLTRSIGMFSLVLWDRSEKRLFLARDRMGEKPLYFGYQREKWVFASELKAIRKIAGLTFSLNQIAVGHYLRSDVVPAPYSIYDGFFKVEPGMIVELLPNGISQKSAYWSFQDVVDREIQNESKDDLTFDDAVDGLERLLKDSIQHQMVADVPVGAFLSGGIDSSTVVALMQQLSGNPVQTFSVGYDEPGYDETGYAATVADHLGTEHHTLRVSPGQVLEELPNILSIYDEPFADNSAIPTYLVSRFAKDRVTVSLSGDAGDELFGGYSHYETLDRSWSSRYSKQGRLLHFIAQVLSPIDKNLGPAGRHGWREYLTSRLEWYAGDTVGEVYRLNRSRWRSAARWLATQGDSQWSSLDDPFLNAMATDTVTYLPDDILVKVDRAAMAVSLETRIPLLDHRIVEYAWSLPRNLKVVPGAPKRVLRGLLERYVPSQLFDRPKMGFGVPTEHWIRGSLKDWAYSMIFDDFLHHPAVPHQKYVHHVWDNHMSEKSNHIHELWNLIVFNAWQQHWM